MRKQMGKKQHKHIYMNGNNIYIYPTFPLKKGDYFYFSINH